MEFDNNWSKSNPHKNNWTIELNQTSEFSAIKFCKTGVENQ